MAKRDKSYAEVHGWESGMKYLYGSAAPAELTEKAKKDTSAHPAYGMLRSLVLDGLGLEGRPNPEYLIITGCMRIFDSPLRLVNYFKLLDQVGIAYTLLKEKEYCSNLPALLNAREEDWEESYAGARELRDRNLAQARALGVRGVAYFCCDGFAIAQKLHTELGSDMETLFYLDVLKERLEGRSFRLEPVVLGWYQGCWRERFYLNPDLKLNLADWRGMLDRIEGVTIVDDLPHKVCCKEDVSPVIEAAERHGVDCIITPCAGCQMRLARAKRVPAKTVSDILLEALTTGNPR